MGTTEPKGKMGFEEKEVLIVVTASRRLPMRVFCSLAWGDQTLQSRGLRREWEVGPGDSELENLC